MDKKNSYGNSKEDNNKLNNNQDDFFNQLTQKEKQLGKKARGGGHNFTTFVEMLLGDW